MVYRETGKAKNFCGGEYSGWRLDAQHYPVFRQAFFLC